MANKKNGVLWRTWHLINFLRPGMAAMKVPLGRRIDFFNRAFCIVYFLSDGATCFLVH